MNDQQETLSTRLAFIRNAEPLKSTGRSAYTASGETESAAEHTWRLCLLAMALEDLLPPLDFCRLLKICVIHDLGEALHGDVPATEQANMPDKADEERHDLQILMQPLDDTSRDKLLELYDEYNAAESTEAKVAKALDKLETLIQHNQGQNPPGFDYAFNLDYGKTFTDQIPVLKQLRSLIDKETRSNLENRT